MLSFSSHFHPCQVNLISEYWLRHTIFSLYLLTLFRTGNWVIAVKDAEADKEEEEEEDEEEEEARKIRNKSYKQIVKARRFAGF